MIFLTNFLKKLGELVFFPVFYFLSLVWVLFHYLRTKFGRYERMPIPVVCVGNITLGGAGKTPTVIFLASYLKKNNINVHVVSRGYGGKFKETVSVNRTHHDASDVGDEPLLISRYAKVWVSRKKRDGIFSSIGAAEILTPLSESFSIKLGSFGEYVVKLFPFE